MVLKLEQEEIEINSGDVLLCMSENDWPVRGLPNMSQNIINVYVVKLLSLKKMCQFLHLKTPKCRKFKSIVQTKTISLIEVAPNYEKLLALEDFNSFSSSQNWQ